MSFLAIPAPRDPGAWRVGAWQVIDTTTTGPDRTLATCNDPVDAQALADLLAEHGAEYEARRLLAVDPRARIDELLAVLAGGGGL